jgi:hypothetical protein
MEKEEKTIHNMKTIISSLKNGSYQIMVDFNNKPRSFISEEQLSDFKVGNTLVSNEISYLKDIAVSFRFLSFSKSFDDSLLPSTV